MNKKYEFNCKYLYSINTIQQESSYFYKDSENTVEINKYIFLRGAEETKCAFNLNINYIYTEITLKI